MTQTITIEALSIASLAAQLQAMPGDTRKRGQAGVMLNTLSAADTAHALSTVINRARRMHAESDNTPAPLATLRRITAANVARYGAIVEMPAPHTGRA